MEKMVVMAILAIRFILSVVQILSKVSFDGGASPFVFVFFRQLVGTAILAPVAFFHQRNKLPKLSLLDHLNLFALSFLGNTFSVDANFVGISYTSATFASATMNSVPVITFVLAVLLRKEPMKRDYFTMVPKLLGVALCAGGIVTMTFYRGPLLQSFNHHRLIAHRSDAADHSTRHSNNGSKEWILGSSLMILACAAWSLFLILQKNFFEKCRSMLVFTTLLGVSSTLQTFVAAYFVERDFSRWKKALSPVDLLVYMLSGLALFLQSWCIKKVGAVVYTMSIPFTLVITILISSFILGESTDLGSVIGGVLMVGGLYAVVLAKQKEEKREDGPKMELEVTNGNVNEEENMKNPKAPSECISNANNV